MKRAPRSPLQAKPSSPGQHATVDHSAKQYAVTDDLGNRVHVNGVENFWKLFKSSVRSTHIHLSERHMQKYVNEFTFRQNHREMGNAMFDVLIAAFRALSKAAISPEGAPRDSSWATKASNRLVRIASFSVSRFIEKP